LLIWVISGALLTPNRPLLLKNLFRKIFCNRKLEKGQQISANLVKNLVTKNTAPWSVLSLGFIA